MDMGEHPLIIWLVLKKRLQLSIAKYVPSTYSQNFKKQKEGLSSLKTKSYLVCETTQWIKISCFLFWDMHK